MASCAAENDVSFVINTGDNFYYCGLQNTSDPQIETDWIKPYDFRSLHIPWYGTLGNHEYGYDVDAQIELAKSMPNWVMDDRYYTRRVALTDDEHATFIFLDSNPCVSAYRSSDKSGWDPCGSEFPTCDPVDEGPCHFHDNILSQDCGEQYEWFKSELKKVPGDDWLLVVAHHPADEMDVEDLTSAMQEHGFDLYLNGHVHTLTQYSIDGNPAYVTSGAGAMLHTQDQEHEKTALKLRGGNLTAPVEAAGASSHDYKTLWNRKVAGFSLHTFSDDFSSLTTDYIDYQGNTIHSFTVKKGNRRRR